MQTTILDAIMVGLFVGVIYLLIIGFYRQKGRTGEE